MVACCSCCTTVKDPNRLPNLKMKLATYATRISNGCCSSVRDIFTKHHRFGGGSVNDVFVYGGVLECTQY